MLKVLRRLSTILPYDAWCFGREDDELARAIRSFVNTHRWRRFSAPSQLALKLGVRTLWLLWCPYRALVVTRRFCPDAPLIRVWQIMKRCYRFGHKPMEVLAPPLQVGQMSALDVGHLRDNHWLLLWQTLGRRDSLRLAQDKVAFAERLSAIGLRVPPLLCELPQGSQVVLDNLPWAEHDRLFIKPRYGSQARGALSLKCLGVGRWQVNNHLVWNRETLKQHLDQFLAHDSLLVQPFLKPLPMASDLSTDAPLELRITTAHTPDGQSFIHSAYLKVQAPSQHATTILSGALAVPVVPGSGLMQYGIRLSKPDQMLSQVPWSGAILTGRTLPHYQEVESMVLAASRILPGVPVLGWDILLTEDGPVILEANTGLSWRLMHLSHALAGTTSNLPQVIRQWLAAT